MTVAMVNFAGFCAGCAAISDRDWVDLCAMAKPQNQVLSTSEKICNSWSAWPATGKLCAAFSVAQLVAFVAAYACYDVGPLYKGKAVADELSVFSMARNALIIPMALITLVAMYQVAEMFSAKPRHRALVISRVCMFEFMVKMTYYTLLSRGYGLAFQNQRSYDERPIYGTRWAGWTFAVPTMVFMNLYPLMDDHRVLDVLIRLFPQMAASATYCLVCGLGCILYDPFMGWFLCILGCVAFVAIVADEIVYLQERLPQTSQPVVKSISVAFKAIMFVLYTLVYLLGNWGFTTSHSVQVFYCFADIAHMAVMSSLLFLYWNLDDAKITSKPDHYD
eukprot:Skav202767  [mRNA]  locus=scaffold326:244883:246032:+ [translate_table: standard]